MIGNEFRAGHNNLPEVSTRNAILRLTPRKGELEFGGISQLGFRPKMSQTIGDSHNTVTRVKTAFVSDLHLGSRYCQAEKFLDFLETHRFDELYLVGDIIDGWRLRSKWRWPKLYHRILHRLLEMKNNGTKLYYTPGNHDEFLRNYLQDFGFVSVQDEFVHEAIDGRRFLIMHGDKFDEVEKQCQWLSVVGARLYEFLLWTNYCVNQTRGLLGLNPWHYSGRVKMKFKTAVNFISDFENKIAEYSRSRDCDAVICGHIHAPTMQEIDDVMYCNTGDWVEHCSALVEHRNGSWELIAGIHDPEPTAVATKKQRSRSAQKPLLRPARARQPVSAAPTQS